mmetsp:Transcript_42190/g.111068  ORF Transcript_42190/g.111068 Transcript_42190/m.111068 type:complete len:280 (-) Transcript_42190:1665-2504(-)
MHACLRVALAKLKVATVAHDHERTLRQTSGRRGLLSNLHWQQLSCSCCCCGRYCQRSRRRTGRWRPSFHRRWRRVARQGTPPRSSIDGVCRELYHLRQAGHCILHHLEAAPEASRHGTHKIDQLALTVLSLLGVQLHYNGRVARQEARLMGAHLSEHVLLPSIELGERLGVEADHHVQVLPQVVVFVDVPLEAAPLDVQCTSLKATDEALTGQERFPRVVRRAQLAECIDDDAEDHVEQHCHHDDVVRELVHDQHGIPDSRRVLHDLPQISATEAVIEC